jgi:hypothetical protein
MNTKSFTLSLIAGTIVYFLLGWLFYGILFTDIYPSEGSTKSLLFVFLGCVFYALLITQILKLTGNIITFKKGLTTGMVLGFIYTLSMNFFMYSSQTLNLEHFIVDVLIGTISTGIMSGIIAFVIGKTNH